MRLPSFAATAALIVAALPGEVASAQTVMHAPRVAPPRGVHPRVNLPGPRWGGKVRGRWYGGHYAPGGWGAYRQPVRGWIMPRYWVAPSFYIQDWSTYGLVRPRPGYGWYRYYDDAVLADRDGRVYDYRGGIDWDARDDGRYVRGDDYYDDYADERYAERRDDGVGGAVIGGVVGGVAGNVIAGRGNRLGGTILGAGVGALAGTAIDRAEDRGRRPPPPPPAPYRGDYGASYPVPGDVPVAPDDGYYDDRSAPDIVYAPPREKVQPIGRRHGPVRGGYVETRPVVAPGASYTTTTTTTHGPAGGYVAGGYYYPPQTVTTVTVAPMVTTTTTTEEIVTYASPRVVQRRVVRHAPRSKMLRR